ncbi:MAG: HAD-IIB family hydrolase [Mariprofundaceae bacterium]|nr:HAD-IIB family hydrolase [Mariprofundaceae bacterium]
MNRLLLCTDLDRTLIPNGSQPESPGARDIFSRLMEMEGVTLAYVSGRHRALIRQAMREYDLPKPAFVIADVGSTIYRVVEGEWQHWQLWDGEISTDWKGLSRAALHELFSGISLLQLQEQEKQNTHKLSYYFPPGQDHQAVMAEMEKRLRERGIRANLIWSIDEIQHVGLLDVLPASASKLHAISFLMRQCGYDGEHTIFAGDSGNDLDVLLSPIHAVLVANADDEVRSAVTGASPNNLYVAQGDFLNMNGNYSAGILEGVAHFRPEFIPLMEGLQQ